MGGTNARKTQKNAPALSLSGMCIG
eukprot:COSAG06_NODE_33030_length_496_cov_1.292191_1_plen_24_part_10